MLFTLISLHQNIIHHVQKEHINALVNKYMSMLHAQTSVNRATFKCNLQHIIEVVFAK